MLRSFLRASLFRISFTKPRTTDRLTRCGWSARLQTICRDMLRFALQLFHSGRFDETYFFSLFSLLSAPLSGMVTRCCLHPVGHCHDRGERADSRRPTAIRFGHSIFSSHIYLRDRSAHEHWTQGAKEASSEVGICAVPKGNYFAKS